MYYLTVHVCYNLFQCKYDSYFNSGSFRNDATKLLDLFKKLGRSRHRYTLQEYSNWARLYVDSRRHWNVDSCEVSKSSQMVNEGKYC